ncbi:putative nucleoside hydrolase [Umbelopsis sp. PMI_123]|nr:putative nucleoside hydrolase [Umbelopsis sp. PMI_123]
MQQHPIILDCDPGIDDVLALILALRSPELKILAVTLTHGNTTLQNVKRNAVTTLDVMAAQHRHDQALGRQSYKQSPVLAVGRETPLDSDQVFATEFHGEDGLGNIYAKGLHEAPTDWEHKLLHAAEKEGAEDSPFETTPRDAADEILYQLANADPLTVTIVAIGPLTNLALAIRRDPKTFSRAKSIVILGGALVAGNTTPYGEFNFVADAIAADTVMSASKGYDQQDDSNRKELISKGEVAPMHIVVLPIDPAECGCIDNKDYQRYIVPLSGQGPLNTFINSFLTHAFQSIQELFNFNYVAAYDAFAVLLFLDMVNGDLEKYWKWEWHDMRVETAGKYTRGMSCIDNRAWETPGGAWNDQQNVVQVITKGNGHHFNHGFFERALNIAWTQN